MLLKAIFQGFGSCQKFSTPPKKILTADSKASTRFAQVQKMKESLKYIFNQELIIESQIQMGPKFDTKWDKSGTRLVDNDSRFYLD